MENIATRQRTHEYFPMVDVVRFLAALMVVGFHLAYSTWKPSSHAADLIRGAYVVPGGEVLWWGKVGVQIFFVISGVVIAASANGAAPYRFLRSRVERLYPGMWICATLVFIVYWVSLDDRSELWPMLIRSLLMAPKLPWMDGQYWTLRIEMAFYAIIFLLILLTSFRHVIAFAGIMAVSSLLCMLGALAYAVGWTDFNVGSFARSGYFIMAPVYYGCFFALGILIWKHRAAGLTRTEIVLLACAVAAGVIETSLEGYALSPYRAGAASMSETYWFIPMLVWLTAVVACALDRPFRYSSDRALPPHLALLRRIGLTTYPLYLIHFAPGVAVALLLVRAGVAPGAAVALATLIVVLLGYVIANLLEPRVRHAFRLAFNEIERRVRIPRSLLSAREPIRGMRAAPSAIPEKGL